MNGFTHVRDMAAGYVGNQLTLAFAATTQKGGERPLVSYSDGGKLETPEGVLDRLTQKSFFPAHQDALAGQLARLLLQL